MPGGGGGLCLRVVGQSAVVTGTEIGPTLEVYFAPYDDMFCCKQFIFLILYSAHNQKNYSGEQLNEGYACRVRGVLVGHGGGSSVDPAP